jgi:hypothetical protein
VSVPSSELGPTLLPLKRVCLPPLDPKGGRSNTPLRARGVGEPNSDDWKESLTLCILCGFGDGDYALFIFSYSMKNPPKLCVTRGCMHRRLIIKKAWLSALSYAQSRISLVFCRSLGFLVPWMSSLTADSDLADFLCYVWRRSQPFF